MKKILIILGLVFILTGCWENTKVENINSNNIDNKKVIDKNEVNNKRNNLSEDIKKEIFKSLTKAEKNASKEADKIIDLTKIWLNIDEINKHNDIRIKYAKINKNKILKKYKISENEADDIISYWIVKWWEM